MSNTSISTSDTVTCSWLVLSVPTSGTVQMTKALLVCLLCVACDYECVHRENQAYNHTLILNNSFATGWLRRIFSSFKSLWTISEKKSQLIKFISMHKDRINFFANCSFRIIERKLAYSTLNWQHEINNTSMTQWFTSRL